MGEGKIVLPVYRRIGACERCHAGVYAPAGGPMPAMSACQCAGGPRLITEAEAAKRASARQAEQKLKEAKAA